MNGDHELIRIIDRVRVELAYTRASLHTYMGDDALTNEIGTLISRCNDTAKQAENLVAKIRERLK